MKKILVCLLALTFFVPFLTSAAATTSDQVLEKILSPEQIKNFKVMKREGNSLYGIKIQKSENGAEAKKLEKISGPWDMSLFEKIKQIGSALWGYKKQITEHFGVTAVTSEVATCLKTTIDKKDSAVKSSVTTASGELVVAIDARGLCQKTALDLTDNKTAIKSFKVCKENFNKTVKDSRSVSKKARDGAWKIYREEVRACYKLNNTATTTAVEEDSDDGGNVLMDDGGNNLDL